VSRVRSLLLAIAVALSAPPIAPASAQSDGEMVEIDVNSERFRVPHRYFYIDVDDVRKRAKNKYSIYWVDENTLKGRGIEYEFWISDSKALLESVRRLPDEMRFHSNYFWPPEPGRPFQGHDDFLIHVNHVSPETIEEALYQFSLFGIRRDTGRKRENYDELKCSVDPNTIIWIDCHSDADGDLLVKGQSGPGADLKGPYGLVSLHFYSRPDGLLGWLSFPALGLPRWKEIVCKALALARDWRVPKKAEPPLTACAKTVAMNEKRE
jgi:hypothetical protein